MTHKRDTKPDSVPELAQTDAEPGTVTLDPRNANTHSDASLGAVRRSVDRLGAGRSIVADAMGTLIAGEATLRAAQDLGIPVRIVETDGSELVAVVRTDIGPDDPRRHALAIADNQTARLSEFDPERMQGLLRELGDSQDLLEATGFDADALAEQLAPSKPVELKQLDTLPPPAMSWALIGRANYLPMTSTTDWESYTHRIVALCERLGVAKYVKHDLQKYLPEGYLNPLRIPQHN